MASISGVWDASEVAEFLDSVRIPIRLATHRGDGSLWIVPLWYRYRNGSFECATAANAHVVKYLRNDSEVGFDISTNTTPYRGVRGNGTATTARDRDKSTLRGLIERYLGGTDNDLARRLLSDDRDEVRLHIQPHELYSWDYSERMRDIESQPP